MAEVQDAQIPGRLKDAVAIVGFADGHREAAPKDNDEFELWGLNRLWSVMERPWTAWFDIHDLQFHYGNQDGTVRDEDHIGFLRGFKGPVYVRAADMDLCKAWGIKSAVAYPMRTVLSRFPRYFTNSISYMMALSLLMGHQKMHVYGVDMAQDSLLQAEYSEQRPGCEFFLGAAMYAGVEVGIPSGSDLLKSSHMYGMEDDTGIQRKRRERRQELGDRKEKMKRDLAQLEAQQNAQNTAWNAQKQQIFAGINQLDGAIQQLTFEARQLSPEPVIDIEVTDG